MPSITLFGHSYDIPDSYIAGNCAPLSPGEAATLNSARRRIIREQFLDMINSGGVPDGAEAEVLAELLRGFTFSVPSPGRASDALDRTVWKLASDLAAEELRKRGRGRDDLSPEQFKALIARISAAPSVRAEGERRLAASRSIAEDVLDLADLAP